jgi:hypothetical protein
MRKAPVARRFLRTAALAVITPLLEKNVLKTLSLDIPVVFSMSRVIVMAFAAAMLRQIWRAGVAGWPESTLAIAIVLAMPVLAAIERVKPADALDLARTLLGRFGLGGVRRMGSAYAQEPSKFDDHRRDD